MTNTDPLGSLSLSNMQTSGNVSGFYIGDPIETTGGSMNGYYINGSFYPTVPDSIYNNNVSYSYSYPVYVDKTNKAIKIVRMLLPKLIDLEKFLKAVEEVKGQL